MKAITRDKEGHFILVKGLIKKENITLVNIHAPNIGALKNIKKLWMGLMGQIDSSTLTPY